MPDVLFDVIFDGDQDLALDVSFEQIGMAGNFDIDFQESYVGGDIPTYDGSYVIKPMTVEQSIDCAAKKMRQNVRVLQIPIHLVTNPQGGLTVNIGE